MDSPQEGCNHLGVVVEEVVDAVVAAVAVEVVEEVGWVADLE